MELPSLIVDAAYLTGFLLHTILLIIQVPLVHLLTGPPVKGWSLPQHFVIRWLRAANSDLNIRHLRMLTHLSGWWRVLGDSIVRDDALRGYWVDQTPVSARCALAEGRTDLVLVYIHGGGFCFGSPFMAFPTLRDWRDLLARQGTRVSILALEYDKAPEYAYPKPVNAIKKTIHNLLRLSGVKANRVVLGGDSAGAHLAVAVVRQLTASELPGGMLLVSPWIRLYPEQEPYGRNLKRDFLTPSALNKWMEAYMSFSTTNETFQSSSPSGYGAVNNAEQRLDMDGFSTPLIPTANASVTTNLPVTQTTPLLVPPSLSTPHSIVLSAARLPRCFILAGEREILVDDTVAYACILEEAGTEVALMVEPRAVHNFAVEPMVAGHDSYCRALANVTGYLKAVAQDDRKG